MATDHHDESFPTMDNKKRIDPPQSNSIMNSASVLDPATVARY